MQRILAMSLVMLVGTFAYPQHHHDAQTSSDSQHQHDAQTSSGAQHQHDAQAPSAANKDDPSIEYGSDPVTVSGYLRDTECLLKNPKAAAAETDETGACLRACVRGGSPLGLLSKEGELYTLFGQETPDTQLHSKLEPFAGHYVSVTGWKVVRGGSQGLVLKSIDLEK